MSKKFKLRMIDLLEETIQEIDKSEKRRDLAVFIAEFWQRAAPSLVAYADAKADTQKLVKKQMENYRESIKQVLKNEK